MATKDEKSREKSRHKSKDRDKSTDRGKSKDREKSSDKVKSKDREKSTDKVKSKDRSKDKPLKEEDSPGSNKENKTHRSKSKDKESKDKEKRHKSREKSSDLNNDAKKDRSEKHKSKSKEDTDGKKHREKKEKETESHMNGSAGGVAVIKQPQVPTEQKETAENYGYEDDFEEYDDDFEDDDEGDEEVAKVTVAPPPSSRRPEQQEADNEEEEAKDTVDDGSKMKAKKRKQDSADSRRKSIQSRIDFSHASAPEISFGALGQAQKRHLRLLNLIDLDGMTYDILEMPPVKDYEFYIQNFGKGNRIQVQTQTGDEDVERDIQTDEVDNEGKWTQHPPMDVHGCGGDTATKTYEDAEEDEFRQFRSGALHSAQFLKFTAAAGQLISDLLSEGHMSMDNNKLEHRTSEPFSTGFNTFSLGALAKDAQVTAVAYCQQQPNFFVTALYIKDSLAEDIAGKTLIVQWSIDDMEVPVMLLLCENMVHSCCYSPNGDTAVFAGLDDGSVVAWDLTESDSLHHVTIPWKSHSDLVLRTATYNTAFLNGVKPLSKSDLYTSPIKTVACIGDLTSDKSVSTYQLACLEECGTVHIWTVLETLSTATETTSELDFGLSPGGKLKLLKSAEIKPSAAVRR
uniref:WD repeat-containing protein 60 n=1 Tax=Plectus sambesii TaxID=2011161 RepID=A0A914WVP8_9BILA